MASAEQPWLNLIGAIVERAIYDYKDAKEWLRKDKLSEKLKLQCEINISSVEIFLRSEWFTDLTGYDGGYLLKSLTRLTS
jgi:hypothetical protein